MSVILDGERLTLDDVVRVARGGERVEVAADAIARVQAARDVVERAVARSDGVGVYGVTTGVGVRKLEDALTAANEIGRASCMERV